MGISEKKLHKRLSLLESAYDLFSAKGINDTSIDDIVKKAEVAKGTFYLYFKDKHDILNRLILRKSASVIGEGLSAMTCAQQTQEMTFDDRVIFFIDFVIDTLMQDKKLLTILHKNLSWGLLEHALNSEETNTVAELFYKNIEENANVDQRTAQHILYLIIEMVGSACYSAIIDNKPYSMEELRPSLYLTVRKILH